jgi:BatD DUF11 like domain
MKKKLLFTTILTILVLGLMALPALAQEPVTAEVDRNYLSTDEGLVLTVTVDTNLGDASRPTLPPLDDFQILSSSSGTQITVVNGDMSVQATYTYVLRPLRAGSLAIEPIHVQINGQTYSTDAIPLEVTQGTGQTQPAPNPGLPNFPSGPGSLLGNLPNLPGFPSIPGSPGGSAPAQPLDPAEMPTELVGQDYFIEAEISNPNPFQGEQLVYTFRFYQAGSLFEQPDYQAPSFTGFWSEELSDQQQHYSTEAAGRPYRVTELQTVLVPTVTGEVTIDPAYLSIPGDFFDAGVELQTQPVTLNVQPLPANAPDSFRGAVGQFDISAQTDVVETDVNDTVTLTVMISGAGNLDTMPDPVWTEGSEWRAFDSKATVNTTYTDGQVQGTRTYERVLVPTTGGDLLLPGVEFSYFNPQTGVYETKSTEPITVHVNGAAQASPQAPAAPGVPAPLTTSSAQVASALRPIKTSAELGRAGSTPMTERSGYWLLWLVPLAVLVGHFGWQRYQQQRLDTADLRRSRGAAGKAQKALDEARKQGDGQEAAGPVLIAYLEEKLNRPIAGLSHTQLASLLAQRSVDADLAARVQNCLMISEMGRFAPADLTGHGVDLWTETALVIDELDQQLTIND